MTALTELNIRGQTTPIGHEGLAALLAAVQVRHYAARMSLILFWIEIAVTACPLRFGSG